MTIDWVDPTVKVTNTEKFVSEADWQLLKDLADNLNARIYTRENDTGGDTNLPVGSIILWAGLEEEIPDGFQICDGTNGLPDMRGVIPFCAGEDADLYVSGGNDLHSHENESLSTSPNHSHSYSIYTGTPSAGAAALDGIVGARAYQAHTHYTTGNSTSSGGSHDHNLGNTNFKSCMPPIIKLFYIGRVS